MAAGELTRHDALLASGIAHGRDAVPPDDEVRRLLRALIREVDGRILQDGAAREAVDFWEHGQRVTKVTGDTHPSGTVLGAFRTTKGKLRVVVELDYADLLHIYSPDQLQRTK